MEQLGCIILLKLPGSDNENADKERVWINIWQCFKDMDSIITSYKCQSGYEFVDDASAAVDCLSVYIPHWELDV